MAEIQIIKADITTLNVDAIVNAANNSLLGGGGVDGAIHLAAGSELLAECKTLGGCNTGQAKITKGYNLPARNVIHTVGPVWHDGGQKEAELLQSCYRECMHLAKIHSINTIAFPAVSCGVYQYPPKLAAEIALLTIKECIDENPNMETVYLVCFGDELLTIYNETWSRLIT
jgi:O-acetyl-ADP-ribose deacetylase (regulator of RNase III)